MDYDDGVTDLEDLLSCYFMVIDPLSVNRQGNDAGIQYRTGIYYTDEAQLPVIRKVFEREQEKAGAALAVAVEPVRNFFPAEEYHQKYLDKNPGDTATSLGLSFCWGRGKRSGKRSCGSA